MKVDGFTTTVEALERWFDLANSQTKKHPYFTLYRGYEAKADRIIYRNEEISEPDKAWALLEEIVQAHADGGGSFRVFLTDKPGGNTGLSTLVKLPSQNAPSAPAGIAGPAAGGGGFGIYGNMKEYMEAEIERRQTEYELKRKIEDLEADQSARVGAIDRFVENLIERPELYQLLQGLGMKAIGALGAGSRTTTQPDPHTAGHEPTGGEHADGFDYDVVEPALEKLRTVFPDTERTLDKLATWAAANPDMAQNIFGQL